jgi:hypothetical protein
VPDKPPGPAPEPPPAAEAVDARRRALVQSLVGRKVSVSTTDLHHVVGRLVALDQDDRLQILVNNQAVQVRRQGIARIHEADPALAEYVK